MATDVQVTDGQVNLFHTAETKVSIQLYSMRTTIKFNLPTATHLSALYICAETLDTRFVHCAIDRQRKWQMDCSYLSS